MQQHLKQPMLVGGRRVDVHGGGHEDKGSARRSSYLPLVPFGPFPSTLFIVSLTLLHPAAETEEGGDGGEPGGRLG